MSNSRAKHVPNRVFGRKISQNFRAWPSGHTKSDVRNVMVRQRGLERSTLCVDRSVALPGRF
jgi:hypothetical protein